MNLFIVENDYCDIRIDKYLIDVLNISRSKIQKMIEKRQKRRKLQKCIAV